MSHFSRRVFLKGSSAALVAAGAITALPATPAVLSALESQGPADAGAADSAATEAAAADSLSGESIIAHVRPDGALTLFSGVREVIVNDPQLAARVVRAFG
jgi:hypothetical protein